MKQWKATDNAVADWSYFDRVYCISLRNRIDRRQQAREQFATVGLAGRVIFMIVDKHPTDCEQGIYESHLSCLRAGLDAGAERILIFEDDVQFVGFSAVQLAETVAFLRRSRDWDAFFFGCLVRGSWKTAVPSVIRINYRSLTHAYVVQRAFADMLVNGYPWNNVAFDAMLCDLRSRRMYAGYPAVAFQSDAISDNDPYLFLDRIRRLCGGLRSVQRWNEWYWRNRLLIIGGHLVAFLGVCLVLLKVTN